MLGRANVGRVDAVSSSFWRSAATLRQESARQHFGPNIRACVLGRVPYTSSIHCGLWSRPGRSPAWRCAHLLPAPSPCAPHEGEACPAACPPELSELRLLQPEVHSVRYVRIFLYRGRRLDGLWRSTGIASSPLTSVSSRRFTRSSFHCTATGVSVWWINLIFRNDFLPKSGFE